jgi:hypothetical protein
MNIEAREFKEDRQSEAQLRKKVRLFKRIVRDNLKDLSQSSKAWGMRVERYRGGFNIFYEREARHGQAVFTIEEPQTAISFEFMVEDSMGIRRNIYDSSDDIFFSDLVADRMITSRRIRSNEIDDLLVFMRTPKSFSADGPPQSLIRVDIEEDALLRSSNLSTWNLPH